MKLKRKLFCEYYLGDCAGNAEMAAIKAGYSAKSARQTAYKLLQSIQVQQYIKQKSDKICSDNIATIEEIQAYWTEVMNDPNELTKNRLRASELLAKAKGMFNDNNW